MTLLRETDYVERAFLAGLLEALGLPVDEQILGGLIDRTRNLMSDIVREYVEDMQKESEP